LESRAEGRVEGRAAQQEGRCGRYTVEQGGRGGRYTVEQEEEVEGKTGKKRRKFEQGRGGR
jgi:hypothetical protein